MQLQPWQTDLLKNLNSGKPGEMFVISSGRQTGKSYMNTLLRAYENQYMSVPYRSIGKADVDGNTWYTVTGQKAVCEWIRTQDKSMWYEHIDSTWHISYNTFDIHENLYTMIGIKF